MAFLKNGRRVSPKREAQRALRNAETRASKHQDPVKQAATLQAGITTALSWLDGTHPKLAQPAEVPSTS